MCFLITDLDQPKVTFHPLTARIREGDDIILSCNAVGNPEAKVSWTRNGSPLDRSNNSRIGFSEGKTQLTVINVSRTDSEEYRCLASNSLRNATSNAVTNTGCTM